MAGRFRGRRHVAFHHDENDPRFASIFSKRKRPLVPFYRAAQILHRVLVIFVRISESLLGPDGRNKYQNRIWLCANGDDAGDYNDGNEQSVAHQIALRFISGRSHHRKCAREFIEQAIHLIGSFIAIASVDAEDRELLTGVRIPHHQPGLHVACAFRRA